MLLFSILGVGARGGHPRRGPPPEVDPEVHPKYTQSIPQSGSSGQLAQIERTSSRSIPRSEPKVYPKASSGQLPQKASQRMRFVIKYFVFWDTIYCYFVYLLYKFLLSCVFLRLLFVI